MIKLKQAVIVEGRYDKARLSSMLDATILTTEGFGIFRDSKKLKLFRTLAEKTGIVILTDSDAAGFRIRSYIAGAVGAAHITHVYIPDIFGKERRKVKAGAEGKLGVEGIPDKILLEAFARAGIQAQISGIEASVSSAGGEQTQGTLVLSENVPADGQAQDRRTDVSPDTNRAVTVADLVEWGLSGADSSAEKRKRMLARLGLPARLNVKSMLRVVNSLYSYEQFQELAEKI